MLALEIALSWLVERAVGVPPPSGLADKYGPLQYGVMAVGLAPLLETLLLQAAPVALGRRCGLGFPGQVFLSAALFMGTHFFEGMQSGITAGLLGGFYLAFTYVHWREASLRTAFWMTVGLHAAHNLASMLLRLASEMGAN